MVITMIDINIVA